MSEKILQVRGLSKHFGKHRAVDGLDLEVARGEFVALLGPNGAGKTTLFQMLTGLFAPDAGTASIAGHDIRRQSTAALAAMGVVFQQPTVDLEMSVVRNLRFHAKLHGLAPAIREQRISEALAAMELSHRAHDRMTRISGGNRRRVEVARALLHEPRLLLMDEASVGLDPASRRDLLLRVADQCRQQELGVLWATHIVDEVAQADRIVVMDHGRVIAAAAPRQLLVDTGTGTLASAFLMLTTGDAKPLQESA